MRRGAWGMLYRNVQVLRATAASMVVVAHSGCVMYVPTEIDILGTSGVDIFFVISGFIICQVAARPHRGAAHFLVRRWWRIFPLYWIVLGFSVAIDNAFGTNLAPWMSGRHSTLDYILLLTTENRFVPQAWSLVFELYFYASLALVLFIAPRGHFYLRRNCLKIACCRSKYWLIDGSFFASAKREVAAPEHFTGRSHCV
jgi:exopolysaccharide production protein ExoZ